MKLWKFLSLIALTCALFYCSKDNELYPENKVSHNQSSVDEAVLKSVLKKNVDLLLSSSRDLITQKQLPHSEGEFSMDEISLINDAVIKDITKLSKVLTMDELLIFLDSEVFEQNTSAVSTPCFDEYQTAYYRAVRELAGCLFFDPGLNCIHSYAEEFYGAINDYTKCIEETYYSEK